MLCHHSARLLLASVGAGLLLAVPQVAVAQESTSREVVQPLPSKDVQRLNRALLKLAKRPKDLETLLEAGDAALKVGDLDAAMGFYGRAEEVAPGNSRVNLGKAAVFMRAGQPTEALPLFQLAEAGGADVSAMLTDRGLAYDLVGDNTAAQAAYTRAIALDKDDIEAKRRLALSYAISGNQAAFEETLRPLLDKRDFGSFRTRAFGLAIMGEQDRAAAIVDAVMPRDLAGRITPYLAYMPRLTRAQQAAAANLGIFPRAADIGREDPRIAAYASGEVTSGSPVARSAASRLEPAGDPLGTPTQSSSRVVRTSAPAQSRTASGSDFDLARAGSSGETRRLPDPIRRTPSASVADAFADMRSGAMPNATRGDGAVDIAALEVPREAPPEPTPPVHPRRIWVQLATGKDVSALKFDWRRISRRAPDLLGKFDPHVTPWGEANRLLAGPVDSRQDARALVNALKEKGIDTFSYTSPEGKEIQELN